MKRCKSKEGRIRLSRVECDRPALHSQQFGGRFVRMQLYQFGRGSTINMLRVHRPRLLSASSNCSSVCLLWSPGAVVDPVAPTNARLVLGARRKSMDNRRGKKILDVATPEHALPNCRADGCHAGSSGRRGGESGGVTSVAYLDLLTILTSTLDSALELISAGNTVAGCSCGGSGG